MPKKLSTLLIVALVASVFVALPAEAQKKKKKKKKKPKVVACASYVPGDMGTEAETLVLTDAATEEAPLEHEFELDANFDEGITGDPPTYTVNVQVDSKAASAGLYASFPFPTRRDYDLYAYWPAGSEAASSHGFNPLIEAKTGPPVPFDVSNTSGNHAGDSQADSENLVGVITPDCGGYTLQMKNYLGEGGTFTLNLWLGEGTEEPLPPA